LSSRIFFAASHIAGRQSDYRSDLEGLRGLAVLAVVGYHAVGSALPGGFVGVDVFFVLSGFLIAKVTIGEMEQGTFSPKDFYARRLLRLAPALISVLAGMLALGWYYLLPHEFVALGKHLAGGASYVSNFVLKGEAGYFDAAAEQKPFLHLWSLAVEAQFYVIWPLCLLALRSRRSLFIFISIAAIASLIACISRSYSNAASAFFMPQYRLWELCAGVLLAVALPHYLPIPARIASMLSIAGFALLVASCLVLENGQPYPGWRALLPVTAGIAIIAAGSGATVNRLLLTTPLMRGLGLVSYSLYLWHWPLLSFVNILNLSHDWQIVCGAVALSLLLAFVTYRCVERPLRRAESRLAIPMIAGGAVCMGLSGLAIMHSNGPSRLSEPYLLNASAAVSDWNWPGRLERDTSVSDVKVYRRGNGPGTIVFVGDSHAQQYWPRAEALADAAGASAPPIEFVTRGGCAPIAGLDYRKSPDCSQLMPRARVIASSADVSTVVFSAAWNIYFTSDTMEMRGVGRIDRQSPGRDAAVQQLTQEMRRLVDMGKAVYLVLGSPIGLSPIAGLNRSLSGEVVYKPARIARARIDQELGPIRESLRKAANNAGAYVIDPMEHLCGPTSCEGTDEAGTPMYRDRHHLRASYVRKHATFLDAAFDIAVGSIR